MIEELDTDYLIIGAGAQAMAFADELVAQSKSLRIILVDRRATPGGHWNNAYSFVTLHQPAAFYGVNSERLEDSLEDSASADLIAAYYARVIKKLCATGRVQFFGECEYLGAGRFKSLNPDGQDYHVAPRLRTVDATYSNVTVPSTRPPPYTVAEGMHAVPIDALANLDSDGNGTDLCWVHPLRSCESHQRLSTGQAVVGVQANRGSGGAKSRPDVDNSYVRR